MANPSVGQGILTVATFLDPITKSLISIGDETSKFDTQDWFLNLMKVSEIKTCVTAIFEASESTKCATITTIYGQVQDGAYWLFI